MHQKAWSISKCDFSFGNKYNYKVLVKLAPAADLRKISQLLLLKGRYYERANKYAEAIDYYLLSLTVANHLSQDKNMTSKMVSIGIEKYDFPLIKEYLGSGKADKNSCKKIADSLTGYINHLFPAKELVESEKQTYVSNLQMLIDEFRKDINKKADLDIKTKESAKVFAEDFKRQANELSDVYYGKFIKAAETNSDGDWSDAVSAFETLKRSAQSRLLRDAGKDESFADVYLKNIKEPSLAHGMAAEILIVSTPDFEKAVKTYYAALKDLSELKSSATEKAE